MFVNFDRRVLMVLFVLSTAYQCSTLDAQIGEMAAMRQILPTQQAISGRIFDESGVSVAGAVIVQYGDSRPSSREQLSDKTPIVNRATTNEDGEFRFENYEFEARTKKYIVHPDFPLTQLRMPLSVLGDIVIKQGDDIRGTILTHDGNPIESAKIAIANLPPRDIIGSAQGRTVSDKHGRFKLENAAINGIAYLTVWTKEGNVSRLTWYQDEGVPNAAQSLTSRPDTTRVGADFEFRMPEQREVKFSVVSAESGEPVAIDRVFVGLADMPTSIRMVRGRSSNVVIDGSHIRSGPLSVAPVRFWIFPSEKSAHVPFVVDVPRGDAEQAVRELKVTASPGCRVSGVAVDSDTGDPIENASIQLIPEQLEKLLEDNYYVPHFINTDADGKFSWVLPAGDIKLRISGRTGNYATIPMRFDRELPRRAIKNEDGTISPGPPTFTVPDGLQETLQLVAGQHVGDVTFKLEQGTIARGIVEDPDGQPLGNVSYICKPVRCVFGTGNFGHANESGEFEIDKLFTNAAENLRSPFAHDQAEVYFWHRERRLSATAMIRESEASNTIVTLKPAKAARGRVIDSKTREPVQGVAIHGNASVASLHLGAVTREDGTFLVDFIPESGLHISLRHESYGYTTHRITIANDQPVIEIGDIEMVSKSVYGTPPKPKIDGMKPKQAIDALALHVATEFAKIPPRANRTSWSSDDPGDTYKSKVRNDVCQAVNKLLDEHEETDIQVEISLGILKAFRNGESTIHSNRSIRRMHQILVANIDHAGLFSRYQSLAEDVLTLGDFVSILESSRDRKRRVWAAYHSMKEGTRQLVDAAGHGHNWIGKSAFERRLTHVVKAWSIAMKEFPKEIYEGKVLEVHANETIEFLVRDVMSGQHNKTRLQAIQDAVRKLKVIPEG